MAAVEQSGGMAAALRGGNAGCGNAGYCNAGCCNAGYGKAGYCRAGMYVGSLVCMSMTLPYAVTRPSPVVTRMVIRAL